MITADGVGFLLLTGASVSYSIALLRIEGLRLALAHGKLPNLAGVWTFAGVLTLPWHLVAALVLAAHVAEWPARKVAGQDLRHYLYSVASVALSCVVATLCYDAIGGPLGIAVGLAVLYALNLALIAAAVIAAAGQARVLRMFLNPASHATEVATLLLGVALAGLMTWHMPLTPAVLPVLLLAHRWSLGTVMDQEEAVEQDTGLLAEKTWAVTGQYFLKDNPGAVALIIIDPDEPEIQQDIIDAIRRCLYTPSDAPPVTLAPDAPTPAPDLLGRYGSRQVAVLVHARSSAGGPMIATDIRRHLRDAGIRAAVGCAVTSDEDLDELVAWALHDLMGRRESAGIATQW